MDSLVGGRRIPHGLYHGIILHYLVRVLPPIEPSQTQEIKKNRVLSSKMTVFLKHEPGVKLNE